MRGELGDLGKVICEGINGHLGFVFFIVTNAGDLAHCWVPQDCPLPGCEPWEDEPVADAKAIGGEPHKFVRLHLVEAHDAPGPEPPTADGGVKDIYCGFHDGSLGSIINTELDGYSKG